MNTPKSPAMIEVDRLPELPVPAWPKDTSFLPEGCIQDDAYDAEQVRVFAFKSAEHLRAAMERLLSSSDGIAAASEEELTDAANDVSQDVELREQAGAILQARAVLRGFKPNTPDATEAIAAERAEVVRLRECLQWYADGKHFILDDDWDTVSGEPQNWLNGPESGMIEDGGVARTVLDGGYMVEGDEEIICEPMLTKEQHATKLIRIKELMARDPNPDSPDGLELDQLAGQVERYEIRVYGAALATPTQGEKS